MSNETNTKMGTLTTVNGIVEELKTGQQFACEAADWFTLSNPKLEQRILSIRSELFFYKTIESYAKRILILSKRGF